MQRTDKKIYKAVQLAFKSHLKAAESEGKVWEVVAKCSFWRLRTITQFPSATASGIK